MPSNPPSKAGVRSGVPGPDGTSLRPRKPLCSLAFDGGSLFTYVSSSASVPLSFTGVESLLEVGIGRSCLFVTSSGMGAELVPVNTGSRSSCVCW